MPDSTILSALVLPSVYRDSAFLMKLSSQAREESGAETVSAMMATRRNKELLTSSGLLTKEMEGAAPQDLIVAIRAEATLIEEAGQVVRKLLRPEGPSPRGASGRRPKSLSQAVRMQPKSNLAIVSTAGDYARFEAAQALRMNLDVLLYSDNISIEDELALKRLAGSKKRVVMGPDCGTAIIDHTPLGFANVVPRGPIGLVASSGTGIQEVACLLGRCGLGISDAYGTGRRDFFDAIGGLTAETALERLSADAATGVAVIIAQAPGEATRRKMIEVYKRLGKPVVLRYLGVEDTTPEQEAGFPVARDLRELALMTIAAIAPNLDASDIDLPSLPPLKKRTAGWLRGIYSGGTLCQEAAEQVRGTLGPEVFSNLQAPGLKRLDNPMKSQCHTFLDMGADEFTVGHPHPMLFPEGKMKRVIEELCDPGVSVVVTDIVLGMGVARNQSAELVRAVDAAARLTGGESRGKIVVASVIGTDQDDPTRSREIDILGQAGVAVAGNHVLAARWAGLAAAGGAHGW